MNSCIKCEYNEEDEPICTECNIYTHLQDGGRRCGRCDEEIAECDQCHDEFIDMDPSAENEELV